MDNHILLGNDYFRFLAYPDGVYIETLKNGYPMAELSGILVSHPEIEITDFNALKLLLTHAPKPTQKIGRLREPIDIEISKDEQHATILFNLPAEELGMDRRESLIKRVAIKLKEKGIVYGIKKELLSSVLAPGKIYTIAEGSSPSDGKDSVIRLYALQETAPDIHSDGKVDFYELKLINRVDAGTWVGERIPATEGIEGKTVKGTLVRPIKGKNFPLLYDRNTVAEMDEGSKTVLYSRSKGAVNIVDGKISISKHLEIPGDVDFSTGNIKFDGYVTIRGTVKDGFSVIATKDIEINSELGLGHIKEIISTEGSIFIKGGIASKGRVEIHAQGDVFTKFADNANIQCKGTVHIGFYSINTDITAMEVLMDSGKGQIIGGHICAEIRIVVPIAGSEFEKKTHIEVTGFNREEMKESLESLFHKLGELKNEQQKARLLMAHLEENGSMDRFQQKEYNESFERLLHAKEDIKDLELTRKKLAGYLKAKGEGEISITKKAFPNCTLVIKGNVIEIAKDTFASSYYIMDGQLKQTN